MTQLLHSFQEQAASLVLFLKSIEKISVFVTGEDGSRQQMFCVKRDIKKREEWAKVPGT
jgi:hypothetical protein